MQVKSVFVLNKSVSSFALKEKGSAFSFVFMCEQGNVLLSSKAYRSRDNALRAITATKRNCVFDERYVIHRHSDDGLRFDIKSENGRIVVSSELYSKESELEIAIAYVKEKLPFSGVLHQEVA